MDDLEALRLLSICETNGSQPLGNIPTLESDSANGMLCQLPAELFVEVQDHLPAQDRWCLAITCRKMYRTVFFPGNYLMQDTETSDIRRRFARDRLQRLCTEDDRRPQSGTAICATCAQRHAIAHFFPHQLLEPRESRGCMQDTLVFACSSPPISWAMAKLSFWRAADGTFYDHSEDYCYLPCDTINLSFPPPLASAYSRALQPAYVRYSRHKHSWRSTPELVLELEYKLMSAARGHPAGLCLNRVEAASLRAYLAPPNQQICPHVRTGDGVVLQLVEGIDEFNIPVYSVPGGVPPRPMWTSATGKCTICATSFGIQEQSGIIHFALWVKRNLGPMGVDHPSQNAQWLLQAVLPTNAPTPLYPL